MSRSSANREVVLQLRPVLVAVVVLLLLGHLAFVAVFHLLDSDALWPLSLSSDASVGTWASALLLVTAALAAAACAGASAAHERAGFGVLAAALTLISLDEVAAQHERVGAFLSARLDLPGFLQYAWVIPAAAIVAGFVVVEWRFVRSVEARLRTGLALAFLLYVGGAIGVEMVESELATRPAGAVSLAYHLLVAVEEGLELAATAVVLLALVQHVARVAPRWQLELSDGDVTVAPAGR